MPSNQGNQSNLRPGQQGASREIKLIIRITIAILFVILGFNLAHTSFFESYPLFGVDYLAEILISLLAAILGFYTVPLLLVQIKSWVESLINKTVSDIVYDFWARQTARINKAKREKQTEKAKKQKTQIVEAVVVDTSVLIDGRILSVVRSGFYDKTLIILKEVVTELQQVADSKEKLKRQRGRRGLDILRDLKKLTKVLIPETTLTEKKPKEVDDLLVDFAKQNNLKLMTLDFNLAKVAEVRGVKVLNLNVLIESLKTVLLPGEEFTTKILQKGKEKNQGIGYLDDGTMIVVEDSKELVGQEVKAKVSKIIQSPAGKMVFCNLVLSEISQPVNVTLK